MTHEMKTSAPTVFLGDSITQAGRWTEWFPESNAVNMGVGGDTTDDVLTRLQDVVDATPGTVVFLAGTNDLGNRRSAPEYVVRNIETILVTLRRELPDARLIVQSVMPRGHDFMDRVHEINVHLRQFSAVVKAEWVDLWPALATENGELLPEYTDDRLHLNDAGYQAWLDVLRPALEHGPKPSASHHGDRPAHGDRPDHGDRSVHGDSSARADREQRPDA